MIFTVNGVQYMTDILGRMCRLEKRADRAVPVQVQLRKNSAEYKRVLAAKHAALGL